MSNFHLLHIKKKKEYDYPQLNAKNTTINKSKILYLKDNFSLLSINNLSKKDTTKDILKLIYDPNYKIH